MVGRPHRNLLGMFKAELIKRLRRIESYAELYRLLETDDVLRSLCIIREGEKPYHPSILLRFRRRIGPEAKRLNMEGFARFFCVAGIGARIGGMVESVRGSKNVLVLDGCSAQCAKKCVDQEGISGYSHLVITDLGIEKKHDFSFAEVDVDRVLSVCRKELITNI
jgi:uncharacterized metal-binding protein